MKELEFIGAIARAARRSQHQHNAAFESDAELFELDGLQLGVTTDEFSAQEDYFSSFDARILGHNLVTATVSDLLASGVRPRFYLHACAFPRETPPGFTRELAEGFAAGLEDAGCLLLGGDTGCAEPWRYTGTALGTVVRPILRKGARPGDRLYATGLFGAGNRQALLLRQLQADPSKATPELRAAASPLFPSRRLAAEAIWKYASFAIDSSDGLLESYRWLAQANPGCLISASLEPRLTDPLSAGLVQRAGLPAELLLMASAGEYELVFGVPAAQAAQFEREAGFDFVPLGEVREGQGLELRLAGDRRAMLAGPTPDPRALPVEQYIQALAQLFAGLQSA